jgi:hypothetical protein
MVVAASSLEFEFNPAAPEFVPRQPLIEAKVQTHSAGCELNLQSPPSYVNTVLVPEEPCIPENGGVPAVFDATAQCAEAGQRAQRKAEDKAQRKPTKEEIKLRPGRQQIRYTAGAFMDSLQVATLVMKNLAVDLKPEEVWQCLDERNATPLKVDFHHDASGAFRGTAFVRYKSPGTAKVAMDRLGAALELGGRKARVELQKSKALFGRRSLDAELPQEDLEIVRDEIERFLQDPACTEVQLPSSFSVFQRKYVHSVAERHSLTHVTQQSDSGEKYVFLSKCRRNQKDAPRSKANSFNLCDMPGPSHNSPKMAAKGAYEPRSERRRKKAHSFCVSEEKVVASPCLVPGLSPLLVPTFPPGLFDSEEEEMMLWSPGESPLILAAAEPQEPLTSIGEMEPAMPPPGLS